MRNHSFVCLLLLSAVSLGTFSCQSARNFSSTTASVYSPKQVSTQPEFTGEAAQIATPAGHTASASQPLIAADLQSDASNDVTYTKEKTTRAVVLEKMKSRSGQLSPRMKASLHQASEVLVANQADREAGKKISREAKKQERAAWRSVLKEAKSNADDQKVVEIILAILLPPLGVYLHEDEINSKFWIDLILTLLFFIPGVVYALLVVTDTI